MASSIHEPHRDRGRRHFRQYIPGKRPLQRDENTLLRHINVADIGQVCAQMRHIPGLARGIDDEKEMVAEIGHHEIVDDPASFRCEYGIALASLG